MDFSRVHLSPAISSGAFPHTSLAEREWWAPVVVWELLLSICRVGKFQYLILKERDTPRFQSTVILGLESPFRILFFPPYFPQYSGFWLFLARRAEAWAGQLGAKWAVWTQQRCRAARWVQSGELSLQHTPVVLFWCVNTGDKTNAGVCD